MPEAFRHPKADKGTHFSSFLAITGPGTFFDPEVDRDSLDPDMTLIIASSENREPWTKPIDLVYKSEESPFFFGGFGFGGFHAVTVSGVSRFLTPTDSIQYLQQFHPPGTKLNGFEPAALESANSDSSEEK